MARKIVHDTVGTRRYERGVKNVVLFPQVSGAYPKGVAWDGVTSLNESPGGGESTAVYADDIQYLNLTSSETVGATIEALNYPEEWAACDGSVQPIPGLFIGQQARQSFGLSYVTTIGNDTDGEAYGYKIHLLYNATAKPSERAFGTINDSTDTTTMSWELSTIPVAIPGYKSAALLVIDSTLVDEAKLVALETILYGTAPSTEGRMPLPSEVLTILAA